MKKTKKIIGVFGCILALVMGLGFGMLSFKDVLVKAETEDLHFVGYSGNMDKEVLHDITRLLRVDGDSPSITIFVHGQGGDPSHFSNNGSGDFVYEQNSMGDLLAKQLNYSINIYHAKFDKDTYASDDFFLYDLNRNLDNPYALGGENFSYSFNNKITKIENVARHSSPVIN